MLNLFVFGLVGFIPSGVALVGEAFKTPQNELSSGLKM
jgi:hypothetical protein